MKIYDSVKHEDNIKIGQLVRIAEGELIYYKHYKMIRDNESTFLFVSKELRDKIIYYVFLNQEKKYEIPIVTFATGFDGGEQTSGNCSVDIEIVG